MQYGLVEQAQRGDAEAFDSLARLVGDRCLAIAVRIFRDVDLAEDGVLCDAGSPHLCRSSRQRLRRPVRTESREHRLAAARDLQRDRSYRRRPGKSHRRRRPARAGEEVRVIDIGSPEEAPRRSAGRDLRHEDHRDAEL